MRLSEGKTGDVGKVYAIYGKKEIREALETVGISYGSELVITAWEKQGVIVGLGPNRVALDVGTAGHVHIANDAAAF